MNIKFIKRIMPLFEALKVLHLENDLFFLSNNLRFNYVLNTYLRIWYVGHVCGTIKNELPQKTSFPLTCGSQFIHTTTWINFLPVAFCFSPFWAQFIVISPQNVRKYWD